MLLLITSIFSIKILNKLSTYPQYTQQNNEVFHIFIYTILSHGASISTQEGAISSQKLLVIGFYSLVNPQLSDQIDYIAHAHIIHLE
jgi:uncharacterized protein (DUF1330 family)